MDLLQKNSNNLGEQYAFCSLGQSCNHSNSGTYEGYLTFSFILKTYIFNLLGTRKIILSEGKRLVFKNVFP
jgi:hypothetical protein